MSTSEDDDGNRRQRKGRLINSSDHDHFILWSRSEINLGDGEEAQSQKWW
jgi:hypothetical protein